ncbi:hypothetical protein G3O08_14835 [Cryomorpha ignava]|uniref:Uncharacterized protein n=1 Tax=Cryomorpha ignava TaxID=101383 RepID=A0A7K3WSW2_9FLAO|nr:hypothetical protein [Cryomorpha ignava]NEN24779.1 hypothetical protein [Cryomorpha ignava]
MIKDIPNLRVSDIALAAIPTPNAETNEDEWYIYLINKKNVPLENVLVSSKGYGILNKDKVETSELRHYVEVIPAMGFAKIETIMPELFAISNQYWVSFYIGKEIFDKKYVFVAESIQTSNLTDVPIIGKKGVLLS